MLALVPSFRRNRRGSTDYLAYPVPKACHWCSLGTWVPRCLVVAISASSLKAAQALGCSLTPRLWVTFGRVTCMARAASVPGPWTLGFLLFWGAGVWVRVWRWPRHSWLGSRMCLLGYGIWLRPTDPGGGLRGVCLHLDFGFTPHFGARVSGGCVCVCWFGFLLHLAIPGSGVRLCVFLCALRLYPAFPSWGSWCVCLGSGFGYYPANPHRGLWVCVFLCAIHLYPAIPGRGVRCGCVCLGLDFGCHPANPGWGVGVYVFVCPLHLYPAIPGSGL